MPSMVLAYDDKSLADMLSWTYTRIPPPSLSRSKRKGVQNPGILKCPSGNDSSIFVSYRTKTSTLPETCSARASNLFLKELMFREKEIYLRFEISNNLGKHSLTHKLLAEEQTTKKIKIYKIFIKLRLVKINPREKSTRSQSA